MTLRRRLAAVLLSVVLGPLLLGALAVGITATRLAEERATERLSAAATVVSTAVNTVCQRARSAAEGLADATAQGRRPAAATSFLVTRGLAESARIENIAGTALGVAGDVSVPVTRWGDCTKGTPPGNDARAVIAAVVELHRADGSLAGRARAAFTVTAADLDALVSVPGVEVTAVTGALPGVAKNASPGAAKNASPGVGKKSETDVRSATLRMRVLEPVPGRPVRTVLRTPAPDATALYGALSVVVLTAAGAALFAANSLAKALTTPLAEVAAAAALVAEGDLAARAPVRVLDEVGQLAATFNRMTRSLQAYVAALTAGRDQLRGTLALLGDTMSSTNDVDRILDVVLESVVATTAAESGVVLLAEERDLVGRRSLGRPHDVRVAIGEGLLGGVAATGEARHGRENCRTFIAVPIVGPPHPPALPEGRLLGVLALHDRLGGDDFDDGDLLTVRSFAGQVAVALENALLHRATDPIRPHRALRAVSRALRAQPTG
ncbi:HAMP domain-containing protein [Cryptosporangium arvum]|uniref:Signal transduction histidine kinase, nitrate/nitrite-specific n=1 Tax=Cryptosporangium arvum DSM 44712 TaxID=927661 RepID=A0A010YXH6_9ACTN|nr:HAMP domain-containing protein [Cryptosporangium arvum]EXG79888.1 signal transduction histidine kinase, nitrate/nitrite-specific [Cryptosporangium arvum DSM 44712]